MNKVNLKVKIAGTEFKNPVIAASGTFGFGREYAGFYKLSVLGGISTKGTTLYAREGNPGTRIAETDGGILNSVGLQNPGIDNFIEDELPFLKKQGTVIIANVAGSTEEDVIRQARERSVGLYGMSSCRSDGSADPPQLILGFGNTSQRQIAGGIALVGDLLCPPAGAPGN